MNVEPKDIAANMKTDADILGYMRLISAVPEIAKSVMTEWEANFVKDVAEKAKQWRDRLTDKQRDKALKILNKPDVLNALALLVSDQEKAKERESEFAEALTSARHPVTVDKTSDPLWGMF